MEHCAHRIDYLGGSMQTVDLRSSNSTNQGSTFAQAGHYFDGSFHRWTFHGQTSTGWNDGISR